MNHKIVLKITLVFFVLTSILVSVFHIQMVKADDTLSNSSGYVGDLTIGNQTVYDISDSVFNLTGRLIIKDNALVRIRNSKILITAIAAKWNWLPNVEVDPDRHRQTDRRDINLITY